MRSLSVSPTEKNTIATANAVYCLMLSRLYTREHIKKKETAVSFIKMRVKIYADQ